MSSTFDTGAEGWTFYTDNVTSVAVDYHATGGNPGDYISHTDPRSGHYYSQRFQSAYPFGGDLSAAYGGTLTFDLRSNAPGDPNPVGVNATFGSGNPAFSSRAEAINSDQHPGSAWTSYTIPLVYSAWCANVSPYPCFENARQLKDGSFKLASKADRGTYFAKTGSKLLADDGLLCTAAKSGPVSVG